MKAIFCFLLSFLLLLLFPKQGNTHNSNLIYIPDISWEPYFFKAASSLSRQGFAMEILQKCIHDQDLKIKRIPSGIKRTEHQLKYGEADLWVMSRREGREQWLDYSNEPLFVDGYAMFVRSNFQISVNSVNDLDNLRVGTVLGLHVTKAFQDWKARQPDYSKPLEFIHEQELLLKLVSKKIDVAITSITPFMSYAKYHDVVQDIKISGKPLRIRNYYTVLSKKGKNIHERNEFIQKLDKCIKDLKETSFIEERKQKYFSNGTYRKETN